MTLYFVQITFILIKEVFMDIKKSLGVKIKDLRRKNGYTQEMFAELIGVAPRHISRIENGVNTPAIETLGRIAKCLNVEVKELFNFPSFHDEEYLKKEINEMLSNLKGKELETVHKILSAIIK